MTAVARVLGRLASVHGSLRGWWPTDAAYHASHGTDLRFEVCLGAILTQNAAWANAKRALGNLKAAGLMDAASIAACGRPRLEALVRPAGTYRQKARYVHALATRIEQVGGLDALFRGRLEEVRARLLELPGIGPETADAILLFAGRRATFVVDAYTRRVSARLGLAPGPATYEELRAWWSERVPRSAARYQQAHALIVEHAKAFCTKSRPRCGTCPLSSVCPRVGV